MKNILLLIHDDAGQEARLQAALDITRAVGGHLKCLDVTPLTVFPGDGFGADGSVIMLQYEQQQESANKARLLKRLEAEDVSWEWADATGLMDRCLQDAARTADLIVVNRQLDDYPIPDMRHICSELVIRSGVRPTSSSSTDSSTIIPFRTCAISAPSSSSGRACRCSPFRRT
jgi:hypothetical protein